MCELLSSETDNPDKTMKNIAECRKMSIPLLPVDVNYSKEDFTIETVDLLGTGKPVKAIRYALTGIKSIGRAVAEEIVRKQPYKSLSDFADKVEGRRIHKKVMQTLILAGLFDCFNPNRYEVLRQYLFEIREFKPDKVECPSPDDWNETERYKLDVQYYGFALSGHPAESLPGTYYESVAYDKSFYISGLLDEVYEYADKRGRDMAKVTIDTPFGRCRLLVYSDKWKEYKSLIYSIKQCNEGPLPLITFLAKKRNFMGSPIYEVIKAFIPDEARIIWQRELAEAMTCYTSRRNRPLLRFYA